MRRRDDRAYAALLPTGDRVEVTQQTLPLVKSCTPDIWAAPGCGLGRPLTRVAGLDAATLCRCATVRGRSREWEPGLARAGTPSTGLDNCADMEAMEPATAAAGRPVRVGEDLVRAALLAAEDLGRGVAEVPVAAIAQRAGISRSTLLRRLGGSRAALDEAVRAAGVDPGGRSVRIRAVHAAAALISESGLVSTTLDAIAGRAGCAVESLYAVFGNRDTLLGAVFDQYSPIVDIDDVLATEHPDFQSTVAHVYRTMAEVLTRQPRVTPAIFAEVLARPTSPAVRSLLQHKAPRLFAVVGAWLDAEIHAGRIRALPLPLLLNQFIAPIVVHMLMRPAMTGRAYVDLPDVDRTCDIFAEAFVRAVGIDPPRPRRPRSR